ncbi:hypothetical protein Q9L58_009629 [Maublancomyces gigas]|uniref:Uncharacterized protein n=1 Tax=Discina gigas TaxID=1032678 RepID=A0ABR3G6C4_9PEZI
MQFKSIVFSLVATLALTQAAAVPERYGGCLQDMGPTLKAMGTSAYEVGNSIVGGARCTGSTSAYLRVVVKLFCAGTLDLLSAKTTYYTLINKSN